MGWIDDLIIRLSGGSFSIAGLLNISAGSIVTEKDKFVTSKGVTKVIQITEMPYHYVNEIITDITKSVASIDRNVLVTSYIEADRCVIPINHQTFVNKASKATQKYYEVKQLFDNLDDVHKKAGIFKHNGMRLQSFTEEDVRKAKQTSDSYTEVRNNIRRNGGVYYQVKLFIHLTFPDIASANIQYEPIYNVIDTTARRASKINKKMATYLLNVSPSVTNIQKINMSSFMASNESLTNLIPYRSQGLVSTRGNLLGTDLKKSSPFFLDQYGTDEGSTVLIVGGIGSGKTVFAQHLGLRSMQNDTTAIHLDLKGGTIGRSLGELMDNYEVINYSGKNAKFINTLILDAVNRDYTMDDAVEATALWFKLMVDLQPDEGNQLDLFNILKAGLRGYYSSLNVDSSNPMTYGRSKDMTLGKAVEFLGANRAQSTNPDEIKLYDIATRRISTLLYENSMYRNDNAIDVTTLYDRDAIVFDFDKDKENSMELIDVIRIFSVIFFTKQISGYNKRNHRFTNLFADEGNQYIYIPGLMDYISDLTARSRSSNTSVIFITNDLSVVKRPEMSGFRSNISTYIIGKVVEDDIKEVAALTGSTRLAKDVELIKKYPGKYEHGFAVYSTLKGRAINSIVRADLPPSVAKAFRTRTVVNS